MEYTNQVRDYIVSNFMYGEAGALQEGTSFLDSGTVDSTGILELIMYLESTYGITIEPEEMTPENLDSIERIAHFLTQKVTRTSPPLENTPPA